MKSMVTLIKPSLDRLPEYVAALEQGWSHDNVNGIETTKKELEKIKNDPAAFIKLLDDREAKGGPITLPDGSTRPRLPSFHRWVWDGEFCGSMKFRWQPGTSELPPHALGHIGYGIVPWKQNRGYATRALHLFLKEVKQSGLAYIEITADPDNIISQKVITSNGGVLIERFKNHPVYGEKEGLRFRITL